jgi:hypothetical protein
VLVVAEAKWLRGRQDKELRKGLQQARVIREFLGQKGDFLVRQKKLSRRISDYRRVVYCVIARDHLIYNDPKDIPVFAFDAVVQAVQNKDIDQGLDFLMSLDWLPKEGRDFWMRRNTASVPGVEISYNGYTRLMDISMRHGTSGPTCSLPERSPAREFRSANYHG